MFRQPANQSDAVSTPFLDDEHDQSDNVYVSSDDLISTRERVYAVLTLAMNFVLFVAVVRGLVERSAMVRWDGAKQLYSPVQDAITHDRQVFTGLTNRTKYHGPPNDDVDKEWEALYDLGISAIPGSQAALLPNRTMKIAGLEDKYIVSLDVFHQLHCLNTLRKYQHPKRYPYVAEQRFRAEAGHGHIDHIDHCIQAIRQSLMCTADRTINSFAWKEDHHRSESSFETVHTCRDFSKIQQWARENQSPYLFQDTIAAHGALVPLVHDHAKKA